MQLTRMRVGESGQPVSEFERRIRQIMMALMSTVEVHFSLQLQRHERRRCLLQIDQQLTLPLFQGAERSN